MDKRSYDSVSDQVFQKEEKSINAFLQVKKTNNKASELTTKTSDFVTMKKCLSKIEIKTNRLGLGMDLVAPGKHFHDTPIICVPGDGNVIGPSCSSLTESEVSSLTTRSGECSISLPQPNKATNAPEPSSHPYAQLRLDPKNDTLVPLLKINLGEDGSNSECLGVIEPLKGLNREDKNACNDKNNDDLLILPSKVKDQSWYDETGLELCLLHDHGDPWEMDARGGCGTALKKILMASRSFVLFRRNGNTRGCESTKESFEAIGYTVLKEASEDVQYLSFDHHQFYQH